MEKETKKKKNSTKKTSAKSTTKNSAKKVETKKTASSPKKAPASTKKASTKKSATKKTTTKATTVKKVESTKPVKKVEVKPTVIEPKEEVKVEKVLTSKTNKENNLLIKIKDFFNSGSEVSKLVIIIIFVSFAFGLFYGVGALINDAKSENKEEENTNVTIQYNEILLGNLFDQKENAYYVLVYERDDTYKSLYFNYLNTISNTEKDFGIYSSDLNIAFNKKFVGDTDVFVDNIKNLKVSSTALLKIENKKVVEIFEKRSDIVSKLKSLTK